MEPTLNTYNLQQQLRTAQRLRRTRAAGKLTKARANHDAVAGGTVVSAGGTSS